MAEPRTSGKRQASSSVALLFLACTGCGGAGTSPPVPLTVGGTVTGLTGTGLVLTDPSAGSVAVVASGTFTLPKALQPGSSYSVSVQSDPVNPPQACRVASGSGEISAPVTTVVVTCTAATAQLLIGGTSIIYRYFIDPTTGEIALASGSPIDQSSAYGDLITDPSGTFVYSTYDSNLAAFSIDPGTGGLLPIADSPYPTGVNPGFMLMDPTGHFIYLDSIAYARDTAGGLTQIGQGVEVDYGCATTQFIYTSNPLFEAGAGDVEGYAINSSTGALSSLGAETQSGDYPAAPCAANSGGTFLFYASATPGNSISSVSTPETYSVNTTSGALAPTTYPGTSLLAAIIVNQAGTFAYITDESLVWGYSINPSTGQLTPIPGNPFSSISGPDKSFGLVSTFSRHEIAFDPSGKFLYVGNDQAGLLSAFTVDTMTGGLTPVPGSPFAMPDGGPAVITATPIPQ
jgi:6-phosphogluconolactonase